MGKAVELRGGYCGGDLRRLARRSRDSDQTRRLLALAAIWNAPIGWSGLIVMRPVRG